MPRYDFRCRRCAQTFEVTRPMSASSDPAPCPAGHDDTVKLLTTVAVGGRGGRAPVPARAGGRRGRVLRGRLLRRLRWTSGDVALTNGGRWSAVRALALSSGAPGRSGPMWAR